MISIWIRIKWTDILDKGFFKAHKPNQLKMQFFKVKKIKIVICVCVNDFFSQKHSSLRLKCWYTFLDTNRKWGLLQKN